AVVCIPPSGTGFRLGTSNVTCTASGAIAPCSFTVTVVDTTPPRVTCNTNITAVATNCAGNVVTYIASATDSCGLGNFDCSPRSGSTFPIGVTTVTCSATDSGGNSNSCSFTVTFVPSASPSIANVSVDKASLWPPNHKMQDVTVSYDITDDCTSQVSCSLTVSSNEPINGTGDGDTAPDWEIVDAHHVRLRAERSGQGSGRIYTISITATDSHGNTSSQTVTVGVPHN